MAALFDVDALRELEASLVGPDATLRYGTAGFRMKAEPHMTLVSLRVGLIAAARSMSTGAKAVGCMITASHNAYEDNGIKIVDPNGGMLDMSWESVCERVVNAESVDEVVAELRSALDGSAVADSYLVLVSKDTRPSSHKLESLLVKGIEECVLLKGIVECDPSVRMTTPQLHHWVRSTNRDDATKSFNGTPVEAYNKHLEHFSKEFGVVCASELAKTTLWVDCANGVGALAMQSVLNDTTTFSAFKAVRLVNTNVDAFETLNDGCGAEFVQKNREFPTRWDSERPDDENDLCCSLDGDADRIVFYTVTANSVINLFDGDKIACLLASRFAQNHEVDVIQTAYANGASMEFVQNKLKLRKRLTKTGVKHLHHEAEKCEEIAVYFEANGHGTVLVNKVTTERTKILRELANQATGDALSDLALVVSVFEGVEKWTSLYEDRPSNQQKVKVVDRTAYECVANETSLTKPFELQVVVNALVEKSQNGRAFLRPSGTENVVRVYAEASNEASARRLGDALAKAVEDYEQSSSTKRARLS